MRSTSSGRWLYGFLAGSALATAFVLAAPEMRSAAAQDKAASKPAARPTDKPFLWRIEGKKPSFLYGTIHVPDARVMALPPVVQKALGVCDAFYAELPMDMATMVGAATRMMLPADKTLRDVLPKDLYERTDKYLRKKGLSFAPLNRLKVWALTAQLELLDFMKEAQNPPLDLLLYTQARDEGKQVGGLETVDEQIGVFDSQTDAEQVQSLAKTLDWLEKTEKQGQTFGDRIVRAYLEGDEAGLMKMMMEYMDPNDPLDRKVMEKLLTERNKTMAKRIADKLHEEKDTSFFFAVGAAHMPGEDGLVRLLEARGFKIKRLTPADAGQIVGPPEKNAKP